MSSVEARCRSNSVSVMPGRVGGLLSEALSLAPSDATLLALAAALPTLLALYIRCSFQARRLRPDTLGKLETIELDRAELLYEKTLRRREEIYRQRAPADRGLRAWYRGRADFLRKFGAELDELDSYARDLRSTIVRLRRRPIRRYKSWINVVSSQSALARALGCYCLLLGLLLASSYGPEPLLWAPGTNASLDTFVLWQAPEGRLLLANWMTASFVAAAMPPFYLVRRVQLYRWNEQQIRSLREFAASDPDNLIDRRRGDEDAAEAAAEQAPPVAPELPAGGSWFDVLGVAPVATIEDVKQAYKALIKQNHPDRVHDMSPLFRALAEAETKKLNLAYAEALMHLREDAASTEQAACAA
jgi:DnaJ domain